MKKKIRLVVLTVLALFLLFAFSVGKVQAAAPVNDTSDCKITDASNPGFNNYYCWLGHSYTIQQNASDADALGYADLDVCQVSLYDNTRATLYWTIQYNETADAFSIITNTYSAITLGTSSATKSGNYTINSYAVNVLERHPVVTNCDLKFFCNDTGGASDTDWIETAQGTYEVSFKSSPGVDTGTDPTDDDETPPIPFNPLLVVGVGLVVATITLAFACSKRN